MYRTMSSAVGDFYSGRPKSAPPMRAGGSTEFGHRFAHNGQRKRAFVYGELNAQASDVDEVEFGGCLLGCGADVAGTVVACTGCSRLKPGDGVQVRG